MNWIFVDRYMPPQTRICRHWMEIIRLWQIVSIDALRFSWHTLLQTTHTHITSKFTDNHIHDTHVCSVLIAHRWQCIFCSECSHYTIHFDYIYKYDVLKNLNRQNQDLIDNQSISCATIWTIQRWLFSFEHGHHPHWKGEKKYNLNRLPQLW